MSKKHSHRKRINRHGITLAGLGVLMLALAFAFVPLYESFCKLVGIPLPTLGTNMEAATPTTTATISDRFVKVRFIGNVAAGVPITLEPHVKVVTARLGESVLTAYHAQNLSDKPLKGQAVHTIVAMGKAVSRDVAGNVDLIQCFCFEEQTYPAKEEVTLPLSFTVRNDLPKGVHTITFAYTLFEME